LLKEEIVLLPFNIAICEDDPEDVLALREMITKSGVAAGVFIFEDTEDFLSAFLPGLFQLVLLDIYFGGTPETGKPDGLEAAVKVRETDPDIWIAFLTSSLVHAKFGYKVKADRYIDKPVDGQEVLSLLERAARHFNETSAEITVTMDYKKHVIRQRDIRYIEIFNKKSVIHLEDETITTYIKIAEMEELLTLPSFLRCHRGFIVNMDYIDGIDEEKRDFIMENGDRVYISKNDQYKFKRAYREYIARLARGGKA
jgi:DNA-binding LytR/AlgR family response regulator